MTKSYWVNGLRLENLKEAIKESNESGMPVYEVTVTFGGE